MYVYVFVLVCVCVCVCLICMHAHVYLYCTSSALVEWVKFWSDSPAPTSGASGEQNSYQNAQKTVLWNALIYIHILFIACNTYNGIALTIQNKPFCVWFLLDDFKYISILSLLLG